MIRERLKDFLEYTESHPLPLYVQDHYGDIGTRHFWCSDWWTEELIKCLLIGMVKYREMERPKKLQGNNKFVPEHIIETARGKWNTMRTIARTKCTCDNLFVCEVGRGIDIIMASFVKHWAKVICYDYITPHGHLIEEYFGERMGIKIDFTTVKSEEYPFDTIDEDVILIANNTKIPWTGGNSIQNNKRILHIIRNGRLLYGRDG